MNGIFDIKFQDEKQILYAPPFITFGKKKIGTNSPIECNRCSGRVDSCTIETNANTVIRRLVDGFSITSP